MDLIEKLKWVTDAVSGQDLGVTALTSYYLNNGYIHASDGRMVVGTPFPFEGSVVVPAAEFERVLVNKPDGEFTWEFETDRLVLKRGRSKFRIKMLPEDTWPALATEPPLSMARVPEDFCESLKLLLPFCSENATKPWATTIAAIQGYLYASNNIVIARVLCPLEERDSDCPQPGVAGVHEYENYRCIYCNAHQYEGPEHLIPRWVAEFIIKRQDGLKSWQISDQHVTFRWADGSWMRSQLVVDKFPDVLTVFQHFYEEKEIDVEITPEWRKTLLRVGKITGDPVLRLRVDQVRGASGEVLSVEEDAGTPCPEGCEETIWDLRYLEDVLSIATHWNPRMYPSPAPWRGDFIEGIVAGRRD